MLSESTKILDINTMNIFTQERDEAIDKLDDRLSDFIAIARVALEKKPQYLEKLGIVEPS